MVCKPLCKPFRFVNFGIYLYTLLKIVNRRSKNMFFRLNICPELGTFGGYRD